MALANVCTSCSNTSASSAATNAVLQRRLRVANESGRPRGRPLGDEWTAGEVDSAPGSGAQLDPPTSSVSHRVLGRTQEAPVRRTGRPSDSSSGEEKPADRFRREGASGPTAGGTGVSTTRGRYRRGGVAQRARTGGESAGRDVAVGVLRRSKTRSRRVSPVQGRLTVGARARRGRESWSERREAFASRATLAKSVGRTAAGGSRAHGGAERGGKRMSMGVVGRAGGGRRRRGPPCRDGVSKNSGAREGRGEGEGEGACAFGVRSGRFAAGGESRESRTASSATCHDVPRDVPRDVLRRRPGRDRPAGPVGCSRQASGATPTRRSLRPGSPAGKARVGPTGIKGVGARESRGDLARGR